MRGGRRRTCEYLGDVGWPAQCTYTECVLAELDEQPVYCFWLICAVECTPCGTQCVHECILEDADALSGIKSGTAE